MNGISSVSTYSMSATLHCYRVKTSNLLIHRIQVEEEQKPERDKPDSKELNLDHSTCNRPWIKILPIISPLQQARHNTRCQSTPIPDDATDGPPKRTVVAGNVGANFVVSGLGNTPHSHQVELLFQHLVSFERCSLCVKNLPWGPECKTTSLFSE